MRRSAWAWVARYGLPFSVGLVVGLGGGLVTKVASRWRAMPAAGVALYWRETCR